MMWDKLNLVRVYTKPKGQGPDYEQPIVLRQGHCSVENFCNAIHKSLVEQFRTAVVYGSSVKHQPQFVGLGHVLKDEDVVTSKFCFIFLFCYLITRAVVLTVYHYSFEEISALYQVELEESFHEASWSLDFSIVFIYHNKVGNRSHLFFF